jgi:hypothetical protein
MISIIYIRVENMKYVCTIVSTGPKNILENSDIFMHCKKTNKNKKHEVSVKSCTEKKIVLSNKEFSIA